MARSVTESDVLKFPEVWQERIRMHILRSSDVGTTASSAVSYLVRFDTGNNFLDARLITTYACCEFAAINVNDFPSVLYVGGEYNYFNGSFAGGYDRGDDGYDRVLYSRDADLPATFIPGEYYEERYFVECNLHRYIGPAVDSFLGPIWMVRDKQKRKKHSPWAMPKYQTYSLTREETFLYVR